MFKWDLNQACENSWVYRQWQVQRSDVEAQILNNACFANNLYVYSKQVKGG
jgi:hypothetical protein